MLDSYGRKIDYLRISLTDKCNLRCIYCMPNSNKNIYKCKDTMSIEEIINIVRASAKLGIEKVRYTGGEPLIFNGIEELIYRTSKIQGIREVSITTNGILLSDMLIDLKNAGLKRFNVSLDTLKNDRYKKITNGGNIDKVILAINKALRIGFNLVKINVVVLKGINDDEIGDFINLTKTLPIEVRFIELMPIGEGIRYYKKMFMSCSEILETFPELIPIKFEKASTAELYRVENGVGKVGFIRPLSCKFCSNCNKIRITSEGKIKPCLHSKEEIDIRKNLGDNVSIESCIKEAILNKPLEHKLELSKRSDTNRMMFQIGG